jgi:uncharacterized membrane protein YfcA
MAMQSWSTANLIAGFAVATGLLVAVWLGLRAQRRRDADYLRRLAQQGSIAVIDEQVRLTALGLLSLVLLLATDGLALFMLADDRPYAAGALLPALLVINLFGALGVALGRRRHYVVRRCDPAGKID